VLTSAQAQDACTQFKTIVNGDLEGQIIALGKQGEILSQPDVWDGPYAQDFRGNIWPAAQKTLRDLKGELDQMQLSLEHISKEIFRSGGAAA
jgi:hypothetical protein